MPLPLSQLFLPLSLPLLCPPFLLLPLPPPKWKTTALFLLILLFLPFLPFLSILPFINLPHFLSLLPFPNLPLHLPLSDSLSPVLHILILLALRASTFSSLHPSKHLQGLSHRPLLLIPCPLVSSP
ncbi:unnamed protein product [Closterium sp. NIES-54]